MKNYSYKFQIMPITPFHIGNGEEHDPLSLVIKNNQAYMLNQLEYIKYLLEVDPKNIHRSVSAADIKGLHKYFRDAFNPEVKQCYYFSYPVIAEIAADYNTKMDNLSSEGFIHAFIRSGLNMQPYIPGSSLKGAFRTAVLSHYCKGGEQGNERNVDVADRKKQAEILKYWKINPRNNKSFADIPSDPFKFLKFADVPWNNAWMSIFKVGVQNPPALMVKKSNFASAYQLRSKRNEPKPQIPVLMELALPSKERIVASELSISITDPANSGIALVLPKGPENPLELIAMVQQYYREQHAKEMSFYERMGADALKNYNAIGTWLQNAKSNECLIKLGMGTGQNYCSYAVMNHNPKSRKLFKNWPLGWMKLKFDV